MCVGLKHQKGWSVANPDHQVLRHVVPKVKCDPTRERPKRFLKGKSATLDIFENLRL